MSAKTGQLHVGDTLLGGLFLLTGTLALCAAVVDAPPQRALNAQPSPGGPSTQNGMEPVQCQMPYDTPDQVCPLN